MMFSISTIASSTRMPATSAKARSVTSFKVKPNRLMTQNVGMVDNGMAIAAKKVARPSLMTKVTIPRMTVPIDNSTVLEMWMPVVFSSTQARPTKLTPMMAAAATTGRHPPRNTATTKVANSAPSNSVSIDMSKLSWT